MIFTPTESSYEMEIGLSFYSTSPPGAGGVAKLYPWDFVVDEVYPPFIRASLIQSTYQRDGRYRCYILSKIKHTTLHAVDHLARAASISAEGIQYAGIKDKKAVAYQVIATPMTHRIDAHRIPASLRIRYIGCSDHPITTREMRGNFFRVRIRGASFQRAQQLAVELGESGCLNYFGYQRFGVPIPINLMLAKAILQEDLQLLEDAIRKSPYATQLSYESRIIKELKSGARSLSSILPMLPPGVLSIILQSYQSYLFNRILSILADSGFDFTKVNPGMIVRALGRYVVARTSWDAIRLTRLCLSRLASICIPIPGHGTTKLYHGLLYQALVQALREVSLSISDIERWPYRLAGAIRPAVIYPLFLDVFADRDSVVLSFYLDRGGYASIVLREIIKSSRIEDYEGYIKLPQSR